jgi:fluoride ion exporter CrcB/FEX
VVEWNSVIGYHLTPTVLTSGVGAANVWVSSGNIYVYNHETFILNSSITANVLFDYTKFTKLNSGNTLLRSVDRISSYYVPNVGMPGSDLAQLMDGVEYGGTKVKGAKFTACNFSHTSNVTSFNYTGLTINSGNVDLTDFAQLGFNIDQPVRIQALVPFDFANNGYFKIVNVSHDYMTLSGEPIQTTYNLIVDRPITVNVGDRITQNNNTANAYVLQSAVNSVVIPIIHVNTGFTFTGNTIKINGLPTISKALGIETGGNVDVKIDYLELDTTVLDSNIYSTYLDTALGTRPEDINIVGGAYVDVYNSHAPEELIPGRMYDALEMRVFSNTTGNTATYGFRLFQPMSSNIQYTRISANTTTTLFSSLGITDSVIYLTDASVMPDPNPMNNIPGVVFINGEKIHYYQRYDTDKLSMASDWQSNTSFVVGSLMNLEGNCYLVKGNVYANTSAYINSANIQQVFNNSLAQIRRSVDGTGANLIHAAGSIVADSSLQQQLPDGGLYYATVTGNVIATANVTWKLTLDSNITANIGDYITQFVNNTGNVRVLSSITNGNIVAVDIIGGNIKLGSNIGTRVNIASPSSYSTTTANILSITPLGTINANGNVVLSGITVLRSNAWVQLNDGTGLQGSTTTVSSFIKEEHSYIP